MDQHLCPTIYFPQITRSDLVKTQQVILTIFYSLGALDLYLTTYQFTVFSAVVHVFFVLLDNIVVSCN